MSPFSPYPPAGRHTSAIAGQHVRQPPDAPLHILVFGTQQSPRLETALAAIDTAFRSRLVKAFLELKDALRLGRFEQAGISTGKLCKTCLRLLQQVTTGKHTPFGQQIPNFADACRAVIEATAHQVPESLRVIMPRALVFAYTMRSKRGTGHVGGDVDANEIDVATMTRVADWLICELIRVYHNLSLEEAQDLVDDLAAMTIPDIWEVGGKKRVLRPGLTAKEKVLLFLHSEATTSVLAEDVCSWTEYATLKSASDVLRPLHRPRLIEYDEDLQTVRVSPLGIQKVETQILKSTP